MIMLTALVVGVGAGLGAVFFRWLISTVHDLSYNNVAPHLHYPYYLLIIPAVGGLVIGPLIYKYPMEAKGHGVPEVMEAVALRAGRMRHRVVILKAIASSICIGTGGSVGQEGPIAQIGSGFGSTVGQVLKLSDDRVRSLVACGAAGGIAATFNAPIGGALFALEVILGRLQTVYFAAVVISAVTASVISQAFTGNAPVFTVPQYELISPWELFLYTILGLLAALGAYIFARSLYMFEDAWDWLPIPGYLKPMLGGLALGVVGILSYKTDGFPNVFGVGYDTIDLALVSGLALSVAFVLLFVKVLATNITLGSGGSGGVFAPSLFMGAMLGEAFGHAVNYLFPGFTAPPGTYALVGMAAFFGGAAHAPATAILILFEMTGDYRVILPLMLATVMSVMTIRMITPESIYTMKLSRRGIRLQQGQDVDVMQAVTVGEAMSVDLDVVNPDMHLDRLGDEFEASHHHGFPVVDAKGDLVGIVSIQDLERAMMARKSTKDMTVADIMTSDGLLVAYPYEPMWMALNRLAPRDVGRLPVVENEGSRKLVGAVRRADIIRDSASFMHLEVSTKSEAVGRQVMDLDMPEGCRIVSVRRGRKLQVAQGHTVLHGGDRVTVFADENCIPIARKVLLGEGVTEKEIRRSSARHYRITIPAGADCIGKMLKDLPLPDDCILVSVRRGEEIMIPRGDTAFEMGDKVEIFGIEDGVTGAIEVLSR
jgi:CIC family chloride channel protein